MSRTVDTMVANEVVSRGFFFGAAPTRSRIHFFPTAGTAGGHYPVGCTLRVFGRDIEDKSVQLDGGRVSQPDGLRIEDAFPHVLAEAAGAIGLEVSLRASQGRLNLLSSQVYIESVSAQMNLVFPSAPFRPLENTAGDVSADEARSTKRSGLVSVADGQIASLVIINSGTEPVQPKLSSLGKQGEEIISLGTVSGNTVFEFPMQELLSRQVECHRTLSGHLTVAPVSCYMSENIDHVEVYVLYRDGDSKMPCSVNVL